LGGFDAERGVFEARTEDSGARAPRCGGGAWADLEAQGRPVARSVIDPDAPLH
jgi:hypothetical protein